MEWFSGWKACFSQLHCQVLSLGQQSIHWPSYFTKNSRVKELQPSKEEMPNVDFPQMTWQANLETISTQTKTSMINLRNLGMQDKVDMTRLHASYNENV